MSEAKTPRTRKVPLHNHPADSLCLLIACPRAGYEAGRAEALDGLRQAAERVTGDRWNGESGLTCDDALDELLALLSTKEEGS